MADCESHENGTENQQSEENLRVPRERNASFQMQRFRNPAPITNRLNRKNDQVSVSQENHQMQSDDPRQIQGDTARNFRNRQGMVSEEAQRFSFSRDRQAEPEMTTFGNATRRQKNRIVYIIGDSMLKNLKRREINSELQSRGITTHVKTFPGATAEDMKFYIQPALKSKPEAVIVHCGTNNMRSEEPHVVVRKIIDVAVQAKSHVPELMVSTLMKRADSQELDAKKTQVNSLLKCH